MRYNDGVGLPFANYRFAISVPGDWLTGAYLYFDPRLCGSGGIDTADMSRDYPEDCRKPLSAWLTRHDAEQIPKGASLVQTFRDLIQNPRCIAYTEELGLCQSSHEQASLSQRPYFGISFLADGRLRADRFLPSEGFPEEIRQFGAGTPVLWEGRVLTLREFAPEASDPSHVWRFQSGSNEADMKRFRSLQSIFMEYRHEPEDIAAEALLREAASDPPLTRERSYLHNALGVREDSGLVIVVANGSLETIGQIALEAGATHAIVVDNGGSPAIAVRKSPDSELRTLCESYYHRPLSVAVAIYDIDPDKDWWLEGAELPFPS